MKKIKFEKNGKIFTLKAIVCENKDLIKFMNRDYFLKLCKNGCSNYNKNWSCPPNSPKFDEFSADYTNSLLVEVTSEVRDKEDYMEAYMTKNYYNKLFNNNPYQNIRTALKNIKNGQTLKLVGTVSYTKYEVDNEKAPLPLIIDKNITIEGSSGKLPTDVDADGLVIRAPIQLGANVTFKNIKLQLVPQVVLGAGGRQNILGAQSPMAATIFAAGNTLTLDNVNTKVGTNSLQDKDRPYISGGTYKNNGTLGKKSVINIINPNSQTKFAAIYAGDYWNDRNIDVEINLNSSVLNNKIYTGGFSKKLTGNVSVRLGDKSNIYSFDKTNHSGNLNVTVDKDSYMDNLDINGIDELTLDENAKVILKKGSDLNIKNINIKKDSVLDLRK